MDSDDNKHSLKVPAGGSAVSPAMCVDLHYPTMRLMAKAQKNKGQLKVEVIYPDSDNPVFQPVGSLTAGSSDKWLASDDLPIYPERGGARPASGGWRCASPPSPPATAKQATGASTTSTSTPSAYRPAPTPHDSNGRPAKTRAFRRSDPAE